MSSANANYKAPAAAAVTEAPVEEAAAAAEPVAETAKTEEPAEPAKER